jgi:hypothetical protein
MNATLDQIPIWSHIVGTFSFALGRLAKKGIQSIKPLTFGHEGGILSLGRRVLSLPRMFRCVLDQDELQSCS